ANSNKLPDDLKQKVFTLLTSDVDGAYAFVKSVTVDDILKIFDYVDVEELLDHEFFAQFEELDGLTEEQIKAKIKEYEFLYTKIINLVTKFYNALPERFKSKSILSVYDENGKFAHSGTHSVDIENVLSIIAPQKAALIASFMSSSVVSATVDLSVEFDKVNKIEYILDGMEHRVGFLPAGADVAYFAEVTVYNNYKVVGWQDALGTVYTQMPDEDITLYAVLEENPTLPDVTVSVDVAPSIDKVYDETESELVANVTVEGIDSSSAEITYLWYKNGNLIAETQTNTYKVKNVADSGEYTCKVIVSIDAAIYTGESNVCSVKIAKAIIDLTKHTWHGGNYIYDGTKKYVYLIDDNGVILTIGVTYFGNVNTEVGKYTATAVFDTENFDVIGSVDSYDWSIEAAPVVEELKVTVTGAISEIYNGSYFELKADVSGTVLETEGVEIKYYWFFNGQVIIGATESSYKVQYVADSGKYTCMVVVAINGAEAESANSNECLVTISKATIDLNNYTWQTGKFIYDGTEKSVYLADANGNVLTFGATYSGNKNTEIGEYTATVVFDTDNFEVIGTAAPYGWSIEKQPDGPVYEITVTIPESINKVFDAQTSAIDAVISGDALLADGVSVSYKWYKNGVEISGAVIRTLSVKNVADSGTYYCEVALTTPDGNFVFTSGECVVAISKASIDLSAYSWLKTKFVYDGTEKAVYLVDSEGNVLTFGTTYVTDGEYTNKATNKGDYVAKAVFDTENIEIVGEIADYGWSIAAAVYDMSGISFKDKVLLYDGKKHSIEIEGTLPEGVTVQYSGKDYTMPGTYEIVATFTGNANYEAISSMKATLRIVGFEKEQEIFNSSGDKLLSVIAGVKGVPETYKLNMRDVSSQYRYFVSDEVFGKGRVGYVLAAYDIHFSENGIKQTTNDSFTVKLLIPVNLRGTNVDFDLVHVSDDGKLELHDFTVEGDYIVFTTSHFSIFSMVEIGDAPVVPEETDLTWLWVLIAVLVILALIAVVIILIIKKRKSDDPEATEAPAPKKPVAPVEEAPVEEAPVEEAPVEEAPVEEAPVEEAPAKEPEIIPVPVVVASGNDEDEGGSKIINGEVVHVRYRTSFMSRLIQAEESIQDYYTVVKNTLLSYDGVKARTSWNFESFNKGRIQCAKLNVKGSAFQVYLGLDPKEYNANKYHFVDVSDKPKLDKVPMLLKVKSERGLKYVVELIEEMMNKFEIEKVDAPNVDYHMPYESTESLAARDLVKIILPAGVTLDGDESFMKVDVGALIETASSDKADGESAPVKEILASEIVHVDAVHADEILTDEEAEQMIEVVERIPDETEEQSDGKFCEINLDTICENFEDGATVTLKDLKEKNLVSKNAGRVKVLARGVMTKKLTIYADKFSLQAVKMIALAGGHADQYN
ncbi:MAG: hypothetical protein E7612_07535, partial [Ruminococcaceae bacterium]|nr:hypothetical protein [Oscillospiraceae bacterium]